MGGASSVSFGEVRIDLKARRVWRGAKAVDLRPKAWALLVFLLDRAGQVVTREEIAEAVWPDVAVGDDSISKAVRELRSALGDDARSPRFLGTVHRVGLRLVLETAEPLARTPVDATGYDGTHRPIEAPDVVGRAAELSVLERSLEKARSGTRRVVFLTGEAGIGKTSVLRAFLEKTRAAPDKAAVLFGQCVECVGVAESYAPVLEAIQSLRAGGADARVSGLLEKGAPLWLAQLSPGSRAAAGDSADASRMLREGLLLVESLAEDRTVVLALEDAHAGDQATIDLVATLARRPAPCRLLVVVTFRPAEAVAHSHPVASVSAELELKGLATRLELGPLDAAAIERVLERRFGPIRDSASLVSLLLGRSGGNPLFLAALVDYLVSSHALEDNDGKWSVVTPLASLQRIVPDRLRSLVDAIVQPLGAHTVELLEAAAAVGMEFDARATAAAIERDVPVVEEACDRLVADGKLLRFLDEVRWNDTTTSARYVFSHQLYQEALYARLAASKRRRLHARIAVRLEGGFGGDCARIAGELADQFQRGGDDVKAISYLARAAEHANRRGAHLDAIDSLTRARALLGPDAGDERHKRRRLRVLMLLLGSVAFGRGFVEPEFEDLLDQCRPLAAEIPSAIAISGFIEFAFITRKLMLSRLDEVVQPASRLIELADAAQVDLFRGLSRGLHGWGLFFAGSIEAAIASFEAALEFDFASKDLFGADVVQAAADFRSYSIMGRASALALLGRVEDARSDARAAADRIATERPVDRLVVATISAFLHAILEDDSRAIEEAERALRLAEESGGGAPWNLAAAILASLGEEGPAGLVDAIADYEARHYRMCLPLFRIVAASRRLARGDAGTARRLLAEPCFEPVWLAEHGRVSAELLLAEGGDVERAYELLRESVRIAREQGARLFEERAQRTLDRATRPI